MQRSSPAKHEGGAPLGGFHDDPKHVLAQAALKQEVVLGGGVALEGGQRGTRQFGYGPRWGEKGECMISRIGEVRR